MPQVDHSVGKNLFAGANSYFKRFILAYPHIGYYPSAKISAGCQCWLQSFTAHHQSANTSINGNKRQQGLESSTDKSMKTVFIRCIRKMVIAYGGFAIGPWHLIAPKCSLGLEVSVTSFYSLVYNLDQLL